MKIFFWIFLFCFSTASFAQEMDRDQYLTMLAREACTCIKNKQSNDSITKADIQAELGICVLKKYSENLELSEKLIGKVIGNDEMATKLGEEVGLKMVVECPDVFKTIVSSIIENKEEQEQKNSSEVFKPSLMGRVVAIKKEQFITISVEDAAKRVHNLIFLLPFEGADLLINEIVKKNDDVELKYFEEEFYDPKIKDYKYFKILQSLKKR
ncbi:hypothetical protein ABGT15_03350 [Flavobacterium enshiense]|uniref:hypothetical protein n=1 Tax=Flavobacterium enshiense TaxID=1341165 RepID=UPI00345CF84D